MPYFLENMVSEDITEVARIERLCFSMPWPTSAYRRELKTPETNRYVVARYMPPEVAQQIGMREPDEATLTALHHPELAAYHNGNSDGQQTQGNKSLLSSLFPWLRNGENGKGDHESHSPFPIVGYAGVWLMVDEAHVTTIGVHPDHRGQGVGELLFLALSDISEELRAHRMTLEVRVSNTSAQALYRKYGFQNAGVRKRYYSDNGEDAYIMWSDPVGSPQFRARIAQLRAELTRRMRVNFFAEQAPARPVDSSRLQ